MAGNLNLQTGFGQSISAIRSNLAYPVQRWVLALSGGVDSIALLRLLVDSELDEPVVAVHINHQLQSAASEWADHCAQLCKAYSVPFQLKTVVVAPREQKEMGVEAAARQVRYQALHRCLMPGDVLLTAQHQNDQAETVLLQLMRGAGVAGLAAMPVIKNIGNNLVQARPLLSFSKAAILAYANEKGLGWCEDESNTNQRFDRNFIRAEVLPLLRERWPAVDAMLAKSAKNCASADAELSNKYNEVLLAGQKNGQVRIVPPQWRAPAFLSVEMASDFGVFRQWLSGCGVTLPVKRLHEFQSQLTGRPGGLPEMNYCGVSLRRYHGSIWLTPALTDLSSKAVQSQLNTWVDIPQGLGQFRIIASNVVANDLVVRLRSGGEKISLSGRGHASDVKELLRTARIFPWLRHYLPLVYYRDELVAIVGLPLMGQVLAELGLSIETRRAAQWAASYR